MYEYPHFVLRVYAVLPVFVCDVAPGLELHRVTAGWADLLLSNQAPGLEPVDKLVSVACKNTGQFNDTSSHSAQLTVTN